MTYKFNTYKKKEVKFLGMHLRMKTEREQSQEIQEE